MPREYTDISVVIPVYDGGARLRQLYQAATRILSSCSNYEIIFVDDGSDSYTKKIIKEIKDKDAHIRTAEFKVNMGQYKALFAGYKCSRGRIVISLDDDAFEEVDYIPDFIKEIERGSDIVLGWRKKKEYHFFRRVASYLFNIAISLIVGKRIHDIGSSIKARNRKAVDKLISLGELPYFLRYYKYYTVSEISIPYKHSKKFSSRYNLIKLIKAGSLILKSYIFRKGIIETDSTGNYSEVSQ